MAGFLFRVSPSSSKTDKSNFLLRNTAHFFIVSAEAQEKIYAHLRGIAPELTRAVFDTMEYNIEWSNENAPDWHEGYQSYEDMKWALLMI